MLEPVCIFETYGATRVGRSIIRSSNSKKTIFSRVWCTEMMMVFVITTSRLCSEWLLRVSRINHQKLSIEQDEREKPSTTPNMASGRQRLLLNLGSRILRCFINVVKLAGTSWSLWSFGTSACVRPSTAWYPTSKVVKEEAKRGLRIDFQPKMISLDSFYERG